MEAKENLPQSPHHSQSSHDNSHHPRSPSRKGTRRRKKSKKKTETTGVEFTTDVVPITERYRPSTPIEEFLMKGPSEAGEKPGNPALNEIRDSISVSPSQKSKKSALEEVREAMERSSESPTRSRKSGWPQSFGEMREMTKELLQIEKAEKELQEIKARTMYQMLFEVRTSFGLKSVVYMTNRQASLFNSSNVEVLLRTFEIKNPSLVLIGLFSVNGVVSVKYGNPQKLYEEGFNWKKHIYSGRQIHLPFRTDEEGIEADRALDIFMRDVIIPLAAQTNAVVIVSPFKSCSMSMSFCKAASMAKASYGDRLPFTIMTFVAAIWLMGVVDIPGSISHDIFNQCDQWKKDKIRINRAYHNVYTLKEDPELADTYDLNPYLENIVIVDGVHVPPNKNEKLRADGGPKASLETAVIDTLTKQVPAVGMGTLVHGLNSMNKNFILGLMQRNVPMMMLDMRIRPDVSKYVEKGERFQALKVAIEKDTEERLALISGTGDRVDNLDACRLSFMHDVLFGDGTTFKSEEHAEVYEPLWAIIATGNNDSINVDGSTGHRELDPSIVSMAVDYLVECEQHANFFLLCDEIKSEYSKKTKGKGDHRTYFKDVATDKWMLNYNLLTHKQLYSGNLHFEQDLKHKIMDLVKMDNMPLKNTHEASIILQSAWDAYDIGKHVLYKFKLIAKITYTLQVLLAVATATVTVISFTSGIEGGDTVSTTDPKNNTNLIIFCLSVASSLVAAIVAYYQPAKRWRQLRGETQFMASQIWRFRTRTGKYTCINNDKRAPERKLLSVVQEIKSRVMDSADLDLTSWKRDYKQKVFQHAQHPPKSALRNLDEMYKRRHDDYVDRLAERVERRKSQNNLAKKEKIKTKAKIKTFKLSYAKVIPSNGEVNNGSSLSNDIDASTNEAKECEVLDTEVNHEKKGKKNSAKGKLVDDDIYFKTDSKKHFLRDNHASPLKPPQYVELRIGSMIQFYKNRIPKYSNILTITTFVLIIGTVASSLLAHLGYGVYVAIISSVLSGTTSLMEFHSTDKKLQRYNATILALEETLLWWRSLTDVERASRKNADALVDLVENTIHNERSSWMATMQLNSDMEKGSRTVSDEKSERRRRKVLSKVDGDLELG
ncbi:MAG: hypothetical protein CMI56_00870 [Parcubacteria group bacterium]|nr:hypothetical protein [Parcubacteria group bacterium]